MHLRVRYTIFISALLLGLLPVVNAEVGGVAVIDGEPVSYDEYERMAYSEARQTFYHSAPSDDASRYLAFRREVAEKLVDRKLMLREARRRGMTPNEEFVALELARYEAQYGTEQWDAEGDDTRSRLSVYFEEESLLEQIDAELRKVEAPGDAEIREYYDANIEKFTQPEQVRLSVILLSVPPWADSGTWDAAREKATQVLTDINDGQDFADAAREHSADPSAANGGDMGFLHAGVLDGELQKIVSELGPGQLYPAPITVLEGVVLVRVEARRAAQVRKLDDVRERAAGLWRRDAEKSAYETALVRLREASEIVLDEEYLGKLPD